MGLHAEQELGREPGLALLGTYAGQGAPQYLLADNFIHSQNLRTDRIAAKTGDVGVALMPSQYRPPRLSSKPRSRPWCKKQPSQTKNLNRPTVTDLLHFHIIREREGEATTVQANG
jgi:hypothetical protein